MRKVGQDDSSAPVGMRNLRSGAKSKERLKMEKLAGTIAAFGLLLAFVGSAVIVGLLFLPVVVLWTLGYCAYDLMKRKD